MQLEAGLGAGQGLPTTVGCTRPEKGALMALVGGL